MSIKNVQNLLERIDALLRSEMWQIAKKVDLQPIQLQMLIYLSRCNRYSDHPAAVSAYFQLTKGTVSQSLKVLVERGYVRRLPDPNDRRKVHFKLTEDGINVVKEANPLPILNAIQLNDQKQIERELEELLRQLQFANRSESFGICHTCRFFLREPDNHYRCGLTQELLDKFEIDLICREHDLQKVSV